MQYSVPRFSVVGLAIVISPVSSFAQTYQVHIVHREESKRELTAVIPATPDAGAADKSAADKASEKSSAEKSATTAKQPAQTHSVTVSGATLTLRLPDRREVRVSCESKYALRFDFINRRSCRLPPADEVTAEFDGDQAKLIWSVSLDGRKTQSETYTILNIVPAPDR